MYIVIIEDYPSKCMDQLQIEYFDTEEQANDFANKLNDQEKTEYSRPTKIKVYRELLEIQTNTDLFNYT